MYTGMVIRMVPEERQAGFGIAPPDAEAERLEAIYAALKQRICTVEIEPGQLIYETQVAQEFGVSRTPIRRVFARLEHDGLIQTLRGVGSRVADLDMATLEDCYRLRIHLAELIGESIDPAAIPKAVEDLEDLAAVADALTDVPDYRAIGRVNVGTMAVILDLIDNAPLREISEMLYMRTTRVWHSAIPQLDWQEEVSFVTGELTELLRALRLGDTMTAGYVRRNYIALAHRRLKSRWRN